MLKFVVFLFAGVLTASVHAQGLVDTAPIRFASGKLVQVGDSEAQVLAKAGMPTREATIETGAGGAVGQRWIYVEPGYSGRTVTIEIYGGVVERLWQERLK